LRDKIVELEAFIISEIDIFMKMLQNTDREVYIKDQILRRAIDKSLNDIILATVDIAANFLKIKKRVTPKTYKEIILATYEFLGDLSYKITPLVKCRNEAIHGYLKINWENVKVIKNAKDDILSYVNKIVELTKNTI
jgi:uncharacterized protein YutE (UPF0331/DUF86 family)